MRRLILLAALLATLPGAASGYEVRYRARTLPDQGVAEITIQIVQQAQDVAQVSFSFDPQHLFGEKADGSLERVDDEESGPRLIWQPPARGGALRYSLRIDQVRDPAEYDARCASRWMLTRAENLFPPMATEFGENGMTDATATVEFDVPPSWKVVHPYQVRNGVGVIEQPHRMLDQPKGWILAGELERITEQIEGSEIRLAAPRHHGARLRDTLAFLRFTLPELREALGTLPERIAIVSAGDPMWRGGLSGPGSVYLHVDRPLIDDDGSSTLLHELVHVATRARSEPEDDWIVEGIAEYYSREVLRRSGAISDKTYDKTLAALARKGRRVERLKGEASGAETALAVSFFADLDAEIRATSDDEFSLDDVVATWVADVEPVSREKMILDVLETTGFDARPLVESRIPNAAPEEAREG